MTVEDCIYSLTRAKEMDGPWIGMLDMIASMEDAGDNTLKINLEYASPALLSTLAMFSCRKLTVKKSVMRELLRIRSEPVLLSWRTGQKENRWFL